VNFCLLLILISGFSWGAKDLVLSTSIYHNNEEVFHSHPESLAMSIIYGPVKKLRDQIEKELGNKLEYFKEWNTNGEAHITVVTPLEFSDVLQSKLSMKEIEAIAERYDLQDSRLSILGLGSAEIQIDGKKEQTYFLIVDSQGLRNIRQQIFYEFVRRGGGRGSFDPTWYFPHVTIGYTKRDLHERDGILKNLKHGLDNRFSLAFTNETNSTQK
jgi:2'-5' RNA ligase